MKASELMLSDYLSYKGRVIKVASITKKKVGYHIKDNENRMHYARLCDCEPISVTTEILEKNGWASMKNGSGDFILTKPMVGNDVTITKIINGYVMVHGAFNGLRIRYIHELQHALRLCKIEKEIIL
jgi:hypothetical protein